MKRWIKKDQLVLKQEALQELNYNIEREWITYPTEGLSIEQVIALTKEHKSLIEEDQGIGFVIIVDSFDKANKIVTAIFNFIDLETGELLWSAKTTGDVGGKSMTSYWALRIVTCLKKFVDDVYSDTLKKL